MAINSSPNNTISKTSKKFWEWSGGIFTSLLLIIATGYFSGFFDKYWKDNSTSVSQGTPLIFSGRVIDQQTNDDIRGAYITIVGRNESDYSQSNGNFEIQFKDSTLRIIKVEVEKEGYDKFYKAYDLPTKYINIPLTKTKAK